MAPRATSGWLVQIADRNRVARLVEATDTFGRALDQREVGGLLDVGRAIDDHDTIAVEKNELHGVIESEVDFTAS
jgi:hypothetical protein